MAGLGRTTEFLDASRTSASATPPWVASASASRTSRSRPRRREILEEADEQVARFQKAYASGFITNGERYNKVIDTWTHANNDVADAMVDHLRAVARTASTRST